MRIPSRPARTASTVALLLLLGPAAAHAQVVRVRVVEETTGRPVPGAIVSLLDAGGATLAQGISGEDGHRLLRAGAPGTVRVRVRRIGFAPYESSPLALAAGDTAVVEARMPATRVALPAVLVEARSRCGRRGRGGAAETAALWEEIRKALELSELTRSEGATHVIGRTFDRELDARGRVISETVSRPRTVAARPFVARAPEELSALGWVSVDSAETRYFAPDERVLLSDAFADEHCFTLVQGRGETEGLLGLGFSPVPGRNVPEIEGTAWVDTAAAELRHVEFRFLPGVLPPELVRDAGGRVAFSRVAGGRWIVSGWTLRMPRFVARRSEGRTQVEFAGWRETGGVADATGAAAVALSAPGRLVGQAYDSVLAMPLVGTEVGLDLAEAPRVGEPAAVTATDSTGRYVFDGVPPGRWRVRLLRPDLDSAGLAVSVEEIVAGGEQTVVDLAVPSARTLRGSCADEGGVLLGTIRDAETRAPFQNAVAVATWTEIEPDPAGRLPRVDRRSAQAVTDATGTYRICGIGADVVTLQALAEDWASGVVDVPLGERRVARHDMTVSRDGGAPTATLAGLVRDSAGAPVANARVSVDGAEGEAVTDSLGRFWLHALPAGTQNALVRALGFVPQRRTVELRRGDTTGVVVALVRAQVLEPVVVAGRDARGPTLIPDVERRRQLGQGYHLGIEDLEGLQTTRSIFALTPSVRAGDTRAVMPPSPDMLIELESSAMPRAPQPDWDRLTADVPAFLVLGRNFRNGEECVAHVFLDGRPLPSHGFLQYIRPEHLVAVEVFTRRSQFPVQISPPMDGCSVVMLWTREAARMEATRAAEKRPK